MNFFRKGKKYHPPLNIFQCCRSRNYQKSLGRSLTDEQKQKIKDEIQLEVKINNEPKLDFKGTDIKTNSLTARGGFASGAVVVDKDKINQQIKDYAAREVSILMEIKGMIKTGGII